MFFTYYLRNSSFQVYFLKHIRKIFFIILFVFIKMVNSFYQKHNKRLRKETRETNQNLSEEENDKI